jgi:hypothetical protein
MTDADRRLLKKLAADLAELKAQLEEIKQKLDSPTPFVPLLPPAVGPLPWEQLWVPAAPQSFPPHWPTTICSDPTGAEPFSLVVEDQAVS